MDGEKRQAVAYRIKVQLSILGSDKDYLEIDSLLRNKGKHYARKNQSIEGRPVAKQNVWAYWGDEPEENSDFEAQWEPISDLIARKRDILIQIGKSAKIQIAVVIHSFSSFPAFNVSQEAIRKIESIGASLDIDLYGSLTGEVF